MSFTNEAVDLPSSSIEVLSLHPISPRYRVINIAITLIFVTVLLIVATALKLELFIPAPEWIEKGFVWIAAGLGSYGLVNVTYHFFADPKIKYAVREQDVHFQSGLFFRKTISQPILRIQHIELKRGPIERKANLATLQVFSAGGIAHTFEIPGLEYEKAVSLRKFIINHKDLSLDE